MESVSRTELIHLFPDETPRELSIPKLDHVDWAVLDYFGWINSAGNLGFVVMPYESRYHTLRMTRSLSSSRKPKTHMCSWCHHVYRGYGTALFSCDVVGSDCRRIIGHHLCKQLDCSLRIRNLASDPPSFMPETIALSDKIGRLENSVFAFMQRTNQFAKRSGAFIFSRRQPRTLAKTN